MVTCKHAPFNENYIGRIEQGRIGGVMCHERIKALSDRWFHALAITDLFRRAASSRVCRAYFALCRQHLHPRNSQSVSPR